MDYDVIIIGAGTSGAYLARKLAEREHRVLVIDKLQKSKVGTKYDIFHIEEKEFANFGIPSPREGDPEWSFEFRKNYTADPRNEYPRLADNPVVGLHMHAYTLRMNEWAAEAGAKFVYGAAFTDFLYEDGKISGVRYLYRGKETEKTARVVADCSGIPAVGRRKLPVDYGVETFSLADDDMFYVILRYVKLKNKEDYLDGSCGWPYFKSWIAPCQDPHGAIIGIGACHSYEYAEKIYGEMLRYITLPEHELQYIEKGCTPYTRPPYSTVADNFIVSGDAACLTKAMNGEGVTSSMVHLRLAALALDRALRLGNTSREALWEIDKKYNASQGAEFAMMRALLTGVVNAATPEEFCFAFSSGMVSDALMDGLNGGKLPPVEIARSAAAFAGGILRGKVSGKTLKAVFSSLRLALALMRQYKEFPDTPEEFDAWRAETDALWKKVGKMK